MSLSDDDKQWIADVIAQSFTQLSGSIMEHVKKRLDEQTQTLREYIDERTHDAETRLLRGFADYNAGATVRFRKLEADVSNFNTSATQRLGYLEEQLADLHHRIILLEGRLH